MRSDVRIVHNRLLGGWFIVRGSHDTPLGGRFDSKEQAQAHLSGVKPLTEVTKQIIAGVGGRFFLINAEGEVARLNRCGKANVWVYATLARGIINAKRQGVRLFDKQAASFVVLS